MLTAILFAMQAAADLPAHEAQFSITESNWRSCAERQAKRLAVRSSEPAETIVTAALALCDGEARAMELARRRVVVAKGGGTDLSDKINAQIIAAHRGRMLAAVIEAR